MQRDGRTLHNGTLETIRLMAVERVLEGEAPSAVIASYGFNRTTIYKWLSVLLWLVNKVGVVYLTTDAMTSDRTAMLLGE
jgi:hypothetical protein